MIKNTFLFLEGIGRAKEKRLWEQGIQEWNDFLKAESIPGVQPERKRAFDTQIQEAKDKLWSGNMDYFFDLLPLAEHWRLWEHCKDEAVFLDIETGERDGITVVGLYDGRECKTFIRGQTLDKQTLLAELNKYGVLVSFNGASFDIPVLQKYFGVTLTHPHIDLMTVCGRVGLKGGLKAIEKELGITRREEVENVRGGDADQLWNMWQASGDKEWLDKLVMYNEEDVLNLETLAQKVIPQLTSKTRHGTLPTLALKTPTH
ncbi:MAG: ribonuclease H-like domain-containing protein [Candidatus Woesearchaeota archaeon]|nr:ribonuclease H-like domain-containing protein [Candidatus Woesearchaeota archaeon]MDP7182194.1 ribonuclease H-like domain-containing protein [Candidatus Woesearchaeota archaeon]MDP7199047.1 ribonuclease H-like domain-containing protein [Candidatus Woesearchaeota archaeon]MDP7467757.1 ribonuclease H-like domain-containing protein [Candidatus Woesearchaeota archaeon]MDP7646460.1 ribonuclease H-like domain-containing protein [Candidatus Woesearchaeota archaeon]